MLSDIQEAVSLGPMPGDHMHPMFSDLCQERHVSRACWGTPLCDANREIIVKYNKPVWMSSGGFHVSVCMGKWITKKAIAPIV